MSNTFKTIRVDTSADDNLNHSRFSKGLSVFLNWLDFESSTALIWENKQSHSIPMILTYARVVNVRNGY